VANGTSSQPDRVRRQIAVVVAGFFIIVGGGSALLVWASPDANDPVVATADSTTSSSPQPSLPEPTTTTISPPQEPPVSTPNPPATTTSTTAQPSPPVVVALKLSDGDGLLRPGDEMQIKYAGQVDPSSLCDSWTGLGNQVLGGSGVTVTVQSYGIVQEIVTVESSDCRLHIGTIRVARGHLQDRIAEFRGDDAKTESTLKWNAAESQLTIQLGALASGVLDDMPQAPSTATYTPDAAIRNTAGNRIDPTTRFDSEAQRF
jgi:hypothetical protein